MIMSIPPPQFEIPTEMRVVAQRSIEQAKLAFGNYMRMTWGASSEVEARVEQSQLDGQEVRHKTMNFVLQNTTLTFEFCQRFVQVKDAPELLRLLKDFIQSQMQILSEQMKVLGLALSKVAMGSMKDSKESELAA
ncbi:MAG: phasin family protein [Rhodoplanes sp.]